MLLFSWILILFCSGMIERTATGWSSKKSNSRTEDVVFSFLLCSSTLSAIELSTIQQLLSSTSGKLWVFLFIFSCYFNFLLFLFIRGETFWHPMDHVHIAKTLITVFEIVPQQDNFLTILMGIWTRHSLDWGMKVILIPITQHGATNQISHGKLKFFEILLHNFMIIHIPLNQLHNSNIKLNHLLLGSLKSC